MKSHGKDRVIQEKGTHLYQSNHLLLSKKEDRTRRFQINVHIKTPTERQETRWWSRRTWVHLSQKHWSHNELLNNHWQKRLKSTQKDTLHPRQKGSHNEMMRCWWVAQSCSTLWDAMDCRPPGSFVHGDSPGKNTGIGCHALLQGIFPTQGSNPGLSQCRQILLSYEPPGRGLFMIWSYSIPATHILENNYITEVLPGVRVLSPKSGSPAWGRGIGRRSLQNIWLWRPVGLSVGTPQDWVRQRLHYWRVPKRLHMHWDPGQSSDTIGAWSRPTFE